VVGFRKTIPVSKGVSMVRPFALAGCLGCVWPFGGIYSWLAMSPPVVRLRPQPPRPAPAQLLRAALALATHSASTCAVRLS
jgi:hypothetical protein